MAKRAFAIPSIFENMGALSSPQKALRCRTEISVVRQKIELTTQVFGRENFGLFLGKHFLGLTDRLSVLLQTSNLDLVAAMTEIENLTSIIQGMYSCTPW